MQEYPSIALGAGVAGLGVAYASGYRTPVFEKNKYAGGLCASFNFDGFRFDQAVHLSHTKLDKMREIQAEIPHYIYHPYPVNWYENGWIKHPVQNNLYALAVDERVKAVMSFLNRPQDLYPQNFADWSISKYGQYIYERFALKYNRKYWCDDLSKMGVDWIENRLYQPSTEEVLYGSYTDDTPNRYYAQEMRYPNQEGFLHFWSNVIARADIRLGFEARHIDTEKKEVSFTNGAKVRYGTLFSSVPLTDMVKLLDEVPQAVQHAAAALNYTSIVLLSIAFNKRISCQELWFYIYDDDILAARVYSPSNKSPDNAPEGKSSLQFEIYFNAQAQPPAKDRCIENTLYALQKMSMASEQDISSIDYRIVQYGNIIPYQDTKEHVSIIHSYLRRYDIIPIGRFGEWDYLWSDQSFMSGYHHYITASTQL